MKGSLSCIALLPNMETTLHQQRPNRFAMQTTIANGCMMSSAMTQESFIFVPHTVLGQFPNQSTRKVLVFTGKVSITSVSFFLSPQRLKKSNFHKETIILFAFIVKRTVPPKECLCNQFTCNDGKCIDLNQRCDGQSDCNESSDETTCDGGK